MGLGVGKILSQKGANVVIVARNKQRLEEAIKQISVGAVCDELVCEMRADRTRVLLPNRHTKSSTPSALI